MAELPDSNVRDQGWVRVRVTVLCGLGIFVLCFHRALAWDV